MRSFSRDENGKEATLCFGIKNSLISDFRSIHNNQLSGLTIECVKKASIIQLKSVDFYRALERFPELDLVHRKHLELRVSDLEKRILGQLILPASARYEKFLKYYSEIEPLVPNYCIASFLGITQESLSRIRLKSCEFEVRCERSRVFRDVKDVFELEAKRIKSSGKTRSIDCYGKVLPDVDAFAYSSKQQQQQQN